jgi:hypothetical protein
MQQKPSYHLPFSPPSSSGLSWFTGRKDGAGTSLLVLLPLAIAAVVDDGDGADNDDDDDDEEDVLTWW